MQVYLYYWSYFPVVPKSSACALVIPSVQVSYYASCYHCWVSTKWVELIQILSVALSGNHYHILQKGIAIARWRQIQEENAIDPSSTGFFQNQLQYV